MKDSQAPGPIYRTRYAPGGWDQLELTKGETIIASHHLPQYDRFHTFEVVQWRKEVFTPACDDMQSFTFYFFPGLDLPGATASLGNSRATWHLLAWLVLGARRTLLLVTAHQKHSGEYQPLVPIAWPPLIWWPPLTPVPTLFLPSPHPQCTPSQLSCRGAILAIDSAVKDV